MKLSKEIGTMHLLFSPGDDRKARVRELAAAVADLEAKLAEACEALLNTERLHVERSAELRAARAELTAKSAELGTALGQRDNARREAERLRDVLLVIERSGAPGATIVARRSDGHACGWCRGMLAPCPCAAARAALAEHGEKEGRDG